MRRLCSRYKTFFNNSLARCSKWDKILHNNKKLFPLKPPLFLELRNNYFVQISFFEYEKALDSDTFTHLRQSSLNWVATEINLKKSSVLIDCKRRQLLLFAFTYGECRGSISDMVFYCLSSEENILLKRSHQRIQAVTRFLIKIWRILETSKILNDLQLCRAFNCRSIVKFIINQHLSPMKKIKC